MTDLVYNSNIQVKKSVTYSLEELLSYSKLVQNQPVPQELKKYIIRTKPDISVNVKYILNKISDSNYDMLLKELLELDISDEDDISLLVTLIFDKAIGEKKFINLYVNLCSDIINKHIYFKSCLLTSCQKLFEKIVNNKVADLLMSKDQFNNFFLFLGSLYNKNIISEKVTVNLLNILITNYSKIVTNPIASICSYFKTIGSDLNKRNPDTFKSLLDKIKLIKDDKTLAIKDKFLIMDLFDSKF